MSITYKLTFTDAKVDSPQYGNSADCLYEVGEAGISVELFWETVQKLVEAEFQVKVERFAVSA